VRFRIRRQKSAAEERASTDAGSPSIGEQSPKEDISAAINPDIPAAKLHAAPRGIFRNVVLHRTLLPDGRRPG